MNAKDKPGWNNRFLSWFGIIMVICYVTLGVVILTSEYFRVTLTGNFRLYLGILLIIYGIYRGWRVFRTWSGNGNNN
jgi:hypothetical protein